MKGDKILITGAGGYIGSVAVYGEAEYVPVDKGHPINPTNPYGASKG